MPKVKITKSSSARPVSRPRKRKYTGNQHSIEQSASFASTSAQKIQTSDFDDIVTDAAHGYRIINFLSVFSALSDIILCKICKGEIKFKETAASGLGFKLVVKCKCNEKFIPSGPFINKAYEINRRIIFVMRLLGVGLDGVNLFCGLMDISKGFSSSLYYSALENIWIATKSVFDVVLKRAADEEKQKNSEAENPLLQLIVSGDGSWKKRGFSSLFGVVSLIGGYSNKIVDVVVKSSYCEQCEIKKSALSKEEFKMWQESHQEECSTDHIGSAGKMEVDGVLEMFSRSERLHGVKYAQYIGNGDSKTFKAILDADPYNGEPIVKKKECIGHTQNNNESYNAVVWHLAPKHLCCGSKTIEIAAYVATAIFNEGHCAILKIFEALGINIGPETKYYAECKDTQRIHDAERRHPGSSKEAKTARRESRSSQQNFFERAEGILYSPGIAD